MIQNIKCRFVIFEGCRVPEFVVDFPEISEWSQIQEVDADTSIFEVHAAAEIFEAMATMNAEYEVMPG